MGSGREPMAPSMDPKSVLKTGCTGTKITKDVSKREGTFDVPGKQKPFK